MSLLKNIVKKLNGESRSKNIVETDYHHRFVPDGHYYSAIPSGEDDNSHLTKDYMDLTNINLNLDNQKKLFEELAPLYKDILFPETYQEKLDSGNKYRYYFTNYTFEHGDGSMLNMFIRKFRPKRIIEVGSGFSSAVMLDTADIYLPEKNIKMTFIEPYTDRLKSILKESDNINLIEDQLQNVPAEDITNNLESGDLLFIDSTHVVKYGSDVLYIFNKILPHLKSGVYVHFHDVHYPFDNPVEWVKNGMHWNEVFFVKQFLAYNNDWEIILWPNMAYNIWNDFMIETFPRMVKVPGASIYLRRK